MQFQERGIGYIVGKRTASQNYELLEPKLNAGEVELLDIPELQEQLLTLVWRGARIDHLPGDHDDYAAAAAGCIALATMKPPMQISEEALRLSSIPVPGTYGWAKRYGW